MAAPPGPDGILQMARTMKSYQFAAEQDVAQAAAKGMRQQIEDQFIDTSFRDELSQFLTNFALYQYVVVTSPPPEIRPVFSCHGANARQTYEPMLVARNVSPFDYFYLHDSPGTGTFDIVRDRLTKYRLVMSATARSHHENRGRGTRALRTARNESRLAESKPGQAHDRVDHRGLDESINVIRGFELLSGRELRQHGIAVDDSGYRENEAVMLGQWTIKLTINPNSDVSERPIYATA
jgi:hypothetical protein